MECSRLKAQITEVENIIKEKLEFIDNLQVNLDEANAAKAVIEAWAKTAENQVVDLQWQF